jgi:hypothetical protein
MGKYIMPETTYGQDQLLLAISTVRHVQAFKQDFVKNNGFFRATFLKNKGYF